MRRNVKYNNNNNVDWSKRRKTKEEKKTKRRKNVRNEYNKLNCLFEIARKLADDLGEKICQIVFCFFFYSFCVLSTNKYDWKKTKENQPTTSANEND